MSCDAVVGSTLQTLLAADGKPAVSGFENEAALDDLSD
jgi:hypothetical protein